MVTFETTTRHDKGTSPTTGVARPVYTTVVSVLTLQTGVPINAIARRIRVKRVWRDDAARCFCSFLVALARENDSYYFFPFPSPRRFFLLASHGYGSCNRVCRYPRLQSELTAVSWQQLAAGRSHGVTQCLVCHRLIVVNQLTVIDEYTRHKYMELAIVATVN